MFPPRASAFASVAIAVVALLPAGCSRPPADTPASEPAPSGPVAAPDLPLVVVLGDSLAAGLGVPEQEAFPAVAERLLREDGLPVRVLNAGVSGDTTAGGLSRLDWLLDQGPEVLVVELGANDGLRGLRLEQTEDNLRQIVRRARERNGRVVLLGMDIPSNYGPEYSTAFSEIYPRIAEDLEVTLVSDFLRDVGGVPEMNLPDGLHPNAEGHRRLGSRLVGPLRAALDERVEEMNRSR